MIHIQRIGTFLGDSLFRLKNNDTFPQKTVKILLGLGVASLAALSWKVIAAGGVLYSVYKGGELARQRFFRNRVVKKEESVSEKEADLAEHLIPPVSAGHEADGDREEHQEKKAIPVEKNDPIEDLKKLQRERTADPMTKNPAKLRLVFEAMIHAPDVLEQGNQLQWIRGKISRYSKMSNSRLHLLIGRRKLKNKIKNLFSCVSRKSDP